MQQLGEERERPVQLLDLPLAAAPSTWPIGCGPISLCSRAI
jgi:hypothetical protein